MNLEQAQNIAIGLMEQHGLIRKGWTFDWDKAKCVAGTCDMARRKITLSREITRANPQTHLINTVLHEIAHALAPFDVVHGPEWKRIARSIGCTGDRCYSKETRKSKAPWIARCPVCGHEREAFRRHFCSCGKCDKNKFNPKYLMLWKRASQRRQAPTPVRRDDSQQMKFFE